MRERMSVTVALIGDPDDPFERIASEDEWNRPYQERRKVQLQVAESDSLAHVLERAVDEMGLVQSADSQLPRFSGRYNGVAFYRPEDENGFAPRYVPRFLLSNLTLVDKQGHAMFGVNDLRTVRYADVMRAAEAGVLSGDPLRPYLIIEPPYGDWIGPDWPTFLEGVKVTWQVLEHVGVAYAAVEAITRVKDEVRKRLRRGEAAIERNSEWAQRHSMPYQFVALFRSRNWTASEAAIVLDCTESDAESVLLVLGFSFDEETGQWQYRGDAAAEVIGDVFTEIQVAAHQYEDLEAGLPRRLDQYFEEGRPPALVEPSDVDEPTSGYRPTAGDRIANVGQSVGELVDHAMDAARAAREAWRARRQG
jgi:hypothetical protein